MRKMEYRGEGRTENEGWGEEEGEEGVGCRKPFEDMDGGMWEGAGVGV